MVVTGDEATRSILVGGEWRGAESYREIVNPATGEVISRQAEADEDVVVEAIGSASEALDRWRATSGFERYQILWQIGNLLSERAETIGETLAKESGKLLAEAVGEVRFSADYFYWFAGQARRLEQLSVVDGRATGPQMVFKKPVGVTASLTPWNFPVSIQARKIAPALAAGCTVIARPSEQAPNSVVGLFGCLMEAGLPEGVANLVTGRASTVTKPMIEDSRVRLISFTGSTGVGKMLYEQSAPTMKRLALELGGCAPFIVLEDANLDHALEQAMIAKMRNCGQSCVAANVYYVHHDLYEKFVRGFAERVRSLKLGDPFDEATMVGPLINAERRGAVEQIRDRAVAAGFESVASASSLDGGPGLSSDCFFAPEVLAAPSYEKVEAELLQTEIFGPLVLVAGFSDLDRLISELNRNSLGLASYVFSKDVAKAIQVAASLEVGISGINEGVASATNVPMGGVKDSGLGREGGHAGMEEFLESHYMAVRGKPFSAWAFGE